MKIVDLEKLKLELDRKTDVKDSYQSLKDFPMVKEILYDFQDSVSVVKLEKLQQELSYLLIELHGLCNGCISQNTDLVLRFEPDPESENPEDVIPLLASCGPESLGAWKSRLKKMRDQLSFDSEAVDIIQKKLDELYEINKL